MLIDEPKPRVPQLGVFLPQSLAGCSNLADDGVSETPELLRYGPLSEDGVCSCRSMASNSFEGSDHGLHLVVVLPVSLFRLQVSEKESRTSELSAKAEESIRKTTMKSYLLEHADELGLLHLQLLPLSCCQIRSLLRARGFFTFQLCVPRLRPLRCLIFNPLPDVDHLVEQLLSCLQVLGTHQEAPPA